MQSDNSLSIATSEQISGSTSKQLAVVAPNCGYSSSDAKADHQRQEVGQDLLAVKELQSRIDDHGNDDPVEECSKDCHAENDQKNRNSGSFDDGYGAISHVTPTGDQSHYNTDSADYFLNLLGFGLCDPVILSAGGKDYWRIPRRTGDQYDWEQITAQAANCRDWPGFIRLLKDRPNACFQSCIGGTTNDEITGGWLLVLPK